MDIVTGIPDLVERVIQCARLIKDASNIDKSVNFDFQHGQHVAHQLILMGDIIKRTKYFPSTEKQIADALRRAEQAATEFVEKLDEVRDKTGINSNQTSSPTSDSGKQSDTSLLAPSSSQETLSEKTERFADACASTARHRHWCCIPFVPFAGRLQKLWSKTKKLNWRKFKGPGRQVVAVAFNRVHFLALIERDIKAALLRMDKAHMDLFNMMFIAPIHSRVVGDEDAQEFIRNAQERLKDERPLERIVIPRQWLSPIDDRLKADEFESERPYTLYTITDGPYAGCLVDRRDVNHLRCRHMEKTAFSDTDTLARLLRRETTSKDGRTDEKIAVLRCRGVSFPNQDLHDLVFQLPPGFGAPQTLRRILLDSTTVNHVRDARVELAIQICTAVHVLHSLNIVHKGVRPDNIILLPSLPSSPKDSVCSAYAQTLGKPYLAGFCYSRSDYSQSGMRKPYEAIFADIIYHHPRHMGRWRQFEFDQADDIYSLGICLLEIGLWHSLLTWSEKEGWYVVGEDWNLDGPQFDNMKQETWFDRRFLFMKLARESLPVTMTSTYAAVVLECLEFGEKEKTWTGGNGPVAHDFVEKIMARLLSMRY